MGYSKTIPNVYVEYAGKPKKANYLINIATDVSLGTIDIPSNLQGSIYQAYVDVVLTSIQDTSGVANKTSGVQYIVTTVNADPTQHNVIEVEDDSLEVDASQTVPYGRIYGNYDISGYIHAGDTLTVSWESGKSDGNTLRFKGIQAILRVILG